jgi:hypothetical protein
MLLLSSIPNVCGENTIAELTATVFLVHSRLYMYPTTTKNV